MGGTDRDIDGAFNARVIAEFRANEGRVGGSLADTPILLLHHVGARSGIERVTPVAYTRNSDGAVIVVGSNGGSHTHPGWAHNLRAHPRIDIELGAERFAARARELSGPERAEIWLGLVEAAPAVGAFQARTRRQIPVFVLTRVN